MSTVISWLSPSYLQAGAIVVLLFILVVSLAQLRHHFVNWSFKGALFGLFFGFLLALILEGFLIIGGKTALTGVLGWKNAPQPITAALDLGREKLIQVLGAKDVINFFQSLNPAEVEKVKKIICQ